MRNNRPRVRQRRGTGVLSPFRRRIDEQRAREFGDLARRLAREREVAEGAVEELIARTPPEHWTELAEGAVLQTSGALEKLGSMVAAAIRTGGSQRALALAEVAVSAAEGVPAAAYPDPVLGQLRAHAWNDYASALLFAGRASEALHATETAFRRLGDYGSLEHDRAVVGLVRAEALQRVGRGVEAMDVIAAAIRSFRDHGDERRMSLAGQLGVRIRVELETADRG